MAFLNSDNYRLWIGDGAGSEAFTELPGQKGMEISFSAAMIDQTVKSDTYEVMRAGLKSVSSFSVDLTPSLPDTTGFTRLETQWKAGASVNLQIRKDGASGDGTDVVYAATHYVENIDLSYQQRTNAAAKISFKLGATPTTNTLAA